MHARTTSRMLILGVATLSLTVFANAGHSESSRHQGRTQPIPN